MQSCDELREGHMKKHLTDMAWINIVDKRHTMKSIKFYAAQKFLHAWYSGDTLKDSLIFTIITMFWLCTQMEVIAITFSIIEIQ